MGLIYKLNFPNGKCYVGQTIRTLEERFIQHVNRAFDTRSMEYNFPIHNAIRKYGPENIIKEILWEGPNDKLNEEEEFEICFENALVSANGYNIRLGGGYTFEKHTEESKDKMSLANRKWFNYDLPRGVSEIHRETQLVPGFKVTLGGKVHAFCNPKLTMDERYEMAMDCYDKISNGLEYTGPKYDEEPISNSDIPLYINRIKDIGFQVCKPGYNRKQFTNHRFSMRKKLDLAIQHLNSLR